MDATRNKMFLAGTLLGIIYGVFAFFIFRDDWHGLTCASFTALVPAALGFLPYVFVDPEQVGLFRKVIFVPWVGMLGLLLASFICRANWLFVVFALSTIPMVSIGVVWWAVGALRIWRTARHVRALTALGLMVLPFVTAAFEPPAVAGEMGRATQAVCANAARLATVPEDRACASLSNAGWS